MNPIASIQILTSEGTRAIRVFPQPTGRHKLPTHWYLTEVPTEPGEQYFAHRLGPMPHKKNGPWVIRGLTWARTFNVLCRKAMGRDVGLRFRASQRRQAAIALNRLAKPIPSTERRIRDEMKTERRKIQATVRAAQSASVAKED